MSAKEAHYENHVYVFEQGDEELAFSSLVRNVDLAHRGRRRAPVP